MSATVMTRTERRTRGSLGACVGGMATAHRGRSSGSASGPALGGGDEIQLAFAGVDLLGPGDLLLLVVDQLAPLGQPSGRAGDGEQHGEHLRRELQRLVDEAGVEVDVRIELRSEERSVGKECRSRWWTDH